MPIADTGAGRKVRYLNPESITLKCYGKRIYFGIRFRENGYVPKSWGTGPMLTMQQRCKEGKFYILLQGYDTIPQYL